MRTLIIAVALSLYATSAFADATCTQTATDKHLAGAALTSFMTKCQKDAKATCTQNAAAKKLAGAAATSYINKCVTDTVGK
ncbi:MAG TPA: hypothetical protein VEC75_12150 [Stellaceae bacterium]|nr:hypothetical protein [Stellaceae bacterium]